MTDKSLEKRIEINERLSLRIRESGLSFGTDAYLLSAFLRDGKGGAGADLGCGTGVLSLFAAARRHFTEIVAYEIQEEYASLAQKNITENGFSDIVRVECRDIRQILPEEKNRFDAVWSNPPYLPLSSGRESVSGERELARREHNGTIAEFAAAASKLLKTKGRFTVVYRVERLARLFDALHSVSLEPKRMILVYPNLRSRPTLALVEAVKEGRPSLVLSSPLVLENPDGTMTDDLQRVYQDFSLSFLFRKGRN